MIEVTQILGGGDTQLLLVSYKHITTVGPAGSDTFHGASAYIQMVNELIYVQESYDEIKDALRSSPEIWID